MLTVSLAELVSALHEADGYLSLVAHRYSDRVGEELASDLKRSSTRVRRLVRAIEDGAALTRQTEREPGL